MFTTRDLTPLPTIAQLSSYVQSIFPFRNEDTPFIYHTPRLNRLNCRNRPAPHVILSITPTPGFYTALSTSAAPTPLAFLHRPWALDRRRLPRHATVLSCHKGFDEVLTVGNNAALASTLGMDLGHSTTIQGYKGDPDRTIGIIGPVSMSSRKDMLELIKGEFTSIEASFGFEDNSNGKPRDNVHQDVSVLAIMNSFHVDDVKRVATLAFDLGLLPSAERCEGILYLTGDVRDQGMHAAVQRQMPVVCVGHRACEEWGIRYLANFLGETWPSIHVDAILEDENAGIEDQAGLLEPLHQLNPHYEEIKSGS
ncbi:hypothetical protein F5B20DRAFT_201538 [Whalleya microplaca]|nr:hypothetical protein F5B20DRAFT_201538 [Whalleya microplaca]